MHSGSILPADSVDCPKAQAIYDTVVAQANCTESNDTLACLRHVDYDTFVRATNSVPSFTSYNSMALSYLPRPDGKVLVDSPEVLVQSGKYAAVPLIIGDQEDEGTLFSFPQTNVSDTASLVEYLSSLFFAGATKSELQVLVETYDESLAAGSPFRTGSAGEVYPGFKRLAALLGDVSLTLARRAMLYDASKAHPSVPVWSYETGDYYGTPVLGTSHGSELLALFGGTQTFASQASFYYYTNFAYSLDPNYNESGSADNKYLFWPKWAQAKQLLNLLRDNSTLLTDDFRSNSYQWIAANQKLLRF
jgi:carboxylesterase type B